MDEKHSEAGLWQRLTDLERSPVYRLYRSVKIKLRSFVLEPKEFIAIGAPAIPVLLKVLKAKDEVRRKRAAQALGGIAEINPGNEKVVKAVPALIEALNDPDGEVRFESAGALGEIGDASAVPALVEALKDKHGRVGWNAADALGKIGDDSAVPALIEALKDNNLYVRTYAARGLERIINHSSVERLDKLKVQIIDAVENADKDAPTYREMKKAAAPLIVAIYKRRNQLLSVEVNIDPNMVLKLPKPPPRSGGMYRAFAMVN